MAERECEPSLGEYHSSLPYIPDIWFGSWHPLGM